jgi:CRP-like cAMP-binding protein
MQREVNWEDIDWPCDLSSRIKRKLLSNCIYKKGVSELELTRRYSQVPGVVYIIKGAAAVFFSTLEKTSIMGGIIGKGDWLGALNIGEETTHFVFSEEIEELEMIIFPHKLILSLSEEEPSVFHWLFECCKIAHRIWFKSYLSSLYTKESRVIFTLVELSNRQNRISGSVACIQISQHQLGLIVGLSRPRLNEVLKCLELDELISLERGKIYLSNMRALSDKVDSMNLSMVKIDHKETVI